MDVDAVENRYNVSAVSIRSSFAGCETAHSGVKTGFGLFYAAKMRDETIDIL